jgi:hypothetical protein
MDQLIQAEHEFELIPNNMTREDGLIVSICSQMLMPVSPPHRMVFPSFHVTFFSSCALTPAVYYPPAHHSLLCALYLTSLLLNPRTAPCRATTLIHVGVVTCQHGMLQVVVMLPSEQHDQVFGWAQSSDEKCSLSPPIVSLHCCEPVA